ncbi:Thymidylate kinase [Symmachiella macrocystis]|uniref:Thymidylate kinase n=1 Tax=Symmachiella macrocystis TaxID=2527985 RepID=A0A5C6BIF5_9PLAN|nr:Thymidylate kinase [Symmachiella macrocystis]
MALLVNIEGIDGSGKGTQAQLLCERLRATGATVQLFSFPRYDDTLFGKSIGDFLNGRFGALDQVSPFLAALLYAGDRFESRELLLAAQRDNDYVVLDRYVASNIGHQASKVTGEERQEIIAWINKIEYEIYALPRPDVTILLNLPPARAQELIARKAPRSYTDDAADIQEADADYLAKVHEVYLDVARSDEGWQIIDGIADGEIRPVDAIADKVWQIVTSTKQ